MKQYVWVAVLIVAGIGLFLNRQQKDPTSEMSVSSERTTATETQPKETTEDEGKTETAYRSANEAFLKAYFTYVSYQGRQEAVEPLLTPSAKEALQLSVFNPNEQVRSAVFKIQSFYQQESPDTVVSLNEIQYTTTMNGIESKLSVVYQLTLEKDNQAWKIDQVQFIGSRTL